MNFLLCPDALMYVIQTGQFDHIDIPEATQLLFYDFLIRYLHYCVNRAVLPGVGGCDVVMCSKSESV